MKSDIRTFVHAAVAALDPQNGAALWKKSEDLVGEAFA
jgi:hypothetical protein